MSVYNAEAFVKEAVESILQQTFTQFEFIIIDDGCTDNTIKIIDSFTDKRICLYRNETNLGLIKSLNKALSKAKGEFIARMDADYIALPGRLECQLDFMSRNNSIGVCGTAAGYIGSENIQFNYPTNHNAIKLSMLYQNPIVHSTAMWRREVFEKNSLWYDDNFPGAEDYELWSRTIFYTEFANLKTPLLLYRLHYEQVTKAKADLVKKSSGLIKLNYLKSVGLVPDAEEERLHLFLFNAEYAEMRMPSIIPLADEWMNKIFLSCNNLLENNTDDFFELWKTKLFVNCIKQYDLNVWKKMCRTIIYQSPHVGFSYRLKFFIKCLLRKKVGSAA